MASISKRGDYQFQVIIRRRGYPSQTKTFETREEGEEWARGVESTMYHGQFRVTPGKICSSAGAVRSTPSLSISRLELEHSLTKPLL